MSILVVGSVAFDSIQTPSGSVDHCLGGAATHFSLAASYFTEVRVIAVVGKDFTAEHEAVFKRRGINIEGIETITYLLQRLSNMQQHVINLTNKLDLYEAEY